MFDKFAVKEICEVKEMLKDGGSVLSENRNHLLNPASCMLAHARVFAGEDAVSESVSVVEAIETRKIAVALITACRGK